MVRWAARTFGILAAYAACALAVGRFVLGFPFLGGVEEMVVAEVMLALLFGLGWVALETLPPRRRRADGERAKPRWVARIAIALVAAAVVFAGGWRVFRQAIPAGVGPGSWVAFLTWSYNRDDLVSPDGRHRVMLRTNDPGALRSGNCWTWAIVESLLRGKRVVAEGFTPEPGYGDMDPFLGHHWNPDGSLTIDFLAGHQSNRNDLAPVTVRPDALE